MRPKKTYKIISDAFEEYWKLTDSNPFYPLFKREVKVALEQHFEYSYKGALEQDNAVTRLKNFNIPYPKMYDIKSARTLEELQSIYTKITDEHHQDFGSEIGNIAYVSDRWACDHRIAFLLWVVDNFTPDELYARMQLRNDPDRVINLIRYKPIIPQSGIPQEYFDELDTFDFTETEKMIKSLARYFPNKVKKYKLPVSVKYIKQTDAGIWITDNAEKGYTSHYRETKSHCILSNDTPTFESRGMWIHGLKGVWRVDAGTSRFVK